MSKPIGIYIHVPFCQSKCPYCDFYSLTGQSASIFDDYTEAVIRSLALWSGRLSGARADTLYFGGGTPTLLGGERLAEIIKAAGRHFGLEGAEITIEANPGDSLEPVFSAFAQAGGNRVSIGAQSFNQEQLRVLGRRHNPADVRAAIEAALSAGIRNISVDIMLCVPTPEPETPDRQIELAVQSASDAAKLRVKHISAYMLKIEKNTPFSDRKGSFFCQAKIWQKSTLRPVWSLNGRATGSTRFQISRRRGISAGTTSSTGIWSPTSASGRPPIHTLTAGVFIIPPIWTPLSAAAPRCRKATA